MKKVILSLFASAILLSSCEREIDISSVSIDNRLVVNALLNNQNNISIFVSKSTNIHDSVKPEPIKNATVVIRDKNGTTTNCAYSLLTDRYECGIVPAPGDYYEVVVNAPGYYSASATLTLPGITAKGDASWRDSTSYDSSGFPQGTIYVTINDSKSEKNYYRVSLYYWKTSLLEWSVLKPLMDDAELDNQAVKTEDGGIIFKDNTFNGKQRKIRFTTPFGYGFQTPKFLVVTENLSEEYYQYYKSLDDYKQNSWLFNEPVPVFTNIVNGAGIFAGSTMQKDTIQ